MPTEVNAHRATAAQARKVSKAGVSSLQEQIYGRIDEHLRRVSAGDSSALTHPFRTWICRTLDDAKLPPAIFNALQRDGYNILSSKDGTTREYFADWELPRTKTKAE